MFLNILKILALIFDTAICRVYNVQKIFEADVCCIQKPILKQVNIPFARAHIYNVVCLLEG
jgi:hypothetical protein